MIIEVFSRYELKFILDEKTFSAVHDRVRERMKPDAYSQDGGFYTISNIYYDTPDNALISAAVRHDGKYRYKIRLRTYDPSRATAFLEIKKKYRSLTSKRRTTILIDDAKAMLTERVFPKEQPFMNMQVTRELFDISKTLTLEPKTVISFDRTAYFGEGDESDLRITFDNAVRARRTKLDLRAGSFGECLLDEGMRIMEVKVAHSVPLWVADMLAENGLCHTHFSKYGAEYKRFIANEQGSKGVILNA